MIYFRARPRTGPTHQPTGRQFPSRDVGDRLEHHLVQFVADTLALDHEMEEGLDTEVSFVPELVSNHRTSARMIETFEHRIRVVSIKWC